MATIYREFLVEAPAAEAWSAIRDFGAVHTRLAVGFVTGTQTEATCGLSRLPTAPPFGKGWWR